MDEWYSQLSAVKSYLVTKDPGLQVVFDAVDANGFQLHTVIKNPYTALVGAIIGQKISYTKARSLRGELYSRYGASLAPEIIRDADLVFLGQVPATIITAVTEYILVNNVDLETEAGIMSLGEVCGIGSWTLDTVRITCLRNWDVFPLNDVFLQKRMQRLYGVNCDMKSISMNWSPYRSLVTWYLWRWF
jgi:3-methyladenine DNA glycosylase/8-oxoguanine DNA glycosylase